MFESAGISIISIKERTTNQTFSITDADTDAADAIKAAYNTVHQPLDSAIYFAVEQVNGIQYSTATVQNYFSEISLDLANAAFVSTAVPGMGANPYKIGIYGRGADLAAIQSLNRSNIDYYWFDPNIDGSSSTFSAPNIERTYDNLSYQGLPYDTDTAFTSDYGQWGGTSTSAEPTLSRVSPTTFAVSSSGQTIQLFGSNFASGDQLLFTDLTTGSSSLNQYS